MPQPIRPAGEDMKENLKSPGFGRPVALLLAAVILGSAPGLSQGAGIRGAIVTWILGDTIPEANVRLQGPVSQQVNAVNGEMARRDLQVDSMKLFFVSGFAGYEKTENDRKFERLFRVKFIDLGCVDPGVCREEYNREIAGFLDRRYGKRWHDLVDIPEFRKKPAGK